MQRTRDSETEEFGPQKALWALFLLLPMNQEILVFPDAALKKKSCITDFLKRGDHLKSKGVSPNDVKRPLWT